MAAQLQDLQTNQITLIDKSTFIIGTEQNYADLKVSSRMVSRAHCRIVCKEDRYYLSDLNSTNGTFLNGTRIPPNTEHPLQFDDELTVGDQKFSFQKACGNVTQKHDIFISFHNTEENGLPGRDVKMAESLYHALRAKGYNPFFSKYSVDESGRSNYMTIIATALEQAKVFIAVGSSRANITSDWVAYEIEMFSNLWLREGRKTRTIITYRSKDFHVNDLPANLAPLQSYDNEGALIRFVGGILSGATGFRQDGDEVTYLYDENGTETSILSGSPVAGVKPPVAKENRLKLGDVVDGKYEILKKIGQGGFSTVYLAEDRSTKKCWAVKELLKENSKNFEVVWDSFQAEISIVKRLNHPAIPAIVDVIESPESFILVMDYVAGMSMQRILERDGTVPEEQILDIAKQLCDVLGYLHSQPAPIIYRDVKPANIMLQPDGKVKIIDFGTSREYKKNAVEDTTCLGTRGYAAPEQYGGMGQTDARTDLYSLGVTLYHLVTGKNPAEPPYEILPLREVDPSLSPGLEYIIQKCTQKDPAQRYQSAEELLKDLENVDHLVKKPFFKARPKKKTKNSKNAFAVPGKTPVVLPKSGFTVPGQGPVVPPRSGYTVPGQGPVVPPRSGYTVPGQGPVVPPRSGFTVPGQGPVVPPRSGGFVPVPKKKPGANVDPRLADAMAKLISLDPTSKEIVLQLIDKLSKS